MGLKKAELAKRRAERDAKAFELASKGRSHKAIAKELGVSLRTVARAVAAGKLARYQAAEAGEVVTGQLVIPGGAEELPETFFPGDDLTDEELKRMARAALVDRARRADALSRLADQRLYAALKNRETPTNWVRDLAWAAGVLADKFNDAVAQALLAGPTTPPRPVRAVFEAKVVDTPAPEGAPKDATVH